MDRSESPTMMMSASQEESGPRQDGEVDSSDSVNILLVDDLKGNLIALDGLLRRDDVVIFKANSGTEALESMISHEFALALIDVQMPGMNGFELAELMRGANRTKTVPIIFVTAGATNQGFSFDGYESGAVDFLYKPLDAHAVKSKVNVFIELHRQKKRQQELLVKLKNTQADLERAVSIRDEFMSMASHELKTPLTSLKLQSQVRKVRLRKGDLPAFTPERLFKMFETDERQLDRITHLIDDMLDISRISSGKLSMNVEQFDLCEVVRDLMERSSGLFVEAGCEVAIEAPEPVVGSWDRFRIEQVVMNLLTNAMRYGAKSPILIQARADRGRARIVVRDHGRGIAPENHERIFRRFERAVSGREISGLGLGLYIVKQIVEAHRGSIRVESELGQGAAFVVELPRSEQNAEGDRGEAILTESPR